MHHLDTNKMHGEKVRWELLKNATLFQTSPESNILQSNSCTVSRMVCEMGDLTNKTCRALQWQCPFMDSYTWTYQYWLPAKIYIFQLCVNTRCSLEDQPGVMDDQDRWQEGVRELCAASLTRWWWWWNVFLLTAMRKGTQPTYFYEPLMKCHRYICDSEVVIWLPQPPPCYRKLYSTMFNLACI